MKEYTYMTFKIFNTLKRQKEEFKPIKAGQVSFYTCGPTVYNFAHIGNFRAYLSADLLRRWLIYGHNYQVDWVLNITDVDDKTIRDSRTKYPDLEAKEALKKFTRYYEEAFFRDLELLGITKEVFLANPRATEYIESMQDLIRKIAEAGFTRVVDGSIFFNTRAWSEKDKYGKLLNLDLSQLKTGMRTLADEIEKENVQDFALWKAEKDGEPAWDFDFFAENLPGRPGWHIECSAMEKELFDLPFDIHSGGVDLIFPHHEDEIAQSKCGYGLEPTNYFMHNEHLLVDGQKMSKSLGNFYTLRDLINKGHSPTSIRFFILSNHYRKKLNLTEEAIVAAKNSLEKIQKIVANIKKEEKVLACEESQILLLVNKAKQDFIAAMNDDLNTPQALAAVFTLMSELKAFLPLCHKSQNIVLDFFKLFAQVFAIPLEAEKENTKVPMEIIKLAEKRQQARQAKDFALSDKLRDEILEKGYELLDEKDGFQIKSK